MGQWSRTDRVCQAGAGVARNVTSAETGVTWLVGVGALD
jgi:hypothetical protein